MCFHVSTDTDADDAPTRAAMTESPVAHRAADVDEVGARRVGRWSPVGVGAAGAVALGYVVIHDPSQGSIVPGCPFLAATGWWCPGCGLTRATHALGHGDIGRALRLNLFVIPILALLGLLYAGWAAHSVGLTQRSLGARLGSRVALLYAFIAVLVVFSVVRNLPGFEFLIGQ